MRFLRNLGIVALVALAITVAPGGGTGLSLVLWLLSIAFFAAIAFFGARLYRDNRFTIESLSFTERAVAYGSIPGALVNFTGTRRLFDLGGAGVLIWLTILGLCSYGIYWVWRHSTEYG